MDLDVVFLRDRRLDADRAACSVGDARPPRRRAPPLIGLRGGYNSSCSGSDLGLVDLEEIFFTHYHADHFLGLPGMLKTFALRGRELP